MQSKKSFSLTEIITAVFIFSLIAAGTGGVLFSTQRSWRRIETELDLVEQARWAIAFIAAEARSAEAAESIFAFGPDKIFALLIEQERIWYWVGDGADYGDIGTLYRGRDDFWPSDFDQDSFDEANLYRQKLSTLIVDNPETDPLFALLGAGPGQQAIITLTTGQGERKVTLRTQIWLRNIL